MIGPTMYSRSHGVLGEDSLRVLRSRAEIEES